MTPRSSLATPLADADRRRIQKPCGRWPLPLAALPLRRQKWRQAVRYRFIALCIALACAATAAPAQVSVSIGIGINVPVYPQLVLVPGYPVYYAPSLRANFFFYDGLYWVLEGDNWYMSSWYNGPWQLVAPVYVPYYVLRVPVRYYRAPPPYFRGWQPSAPPRWGRHWGPQWEQQHRGWDKWNRRAVPAPAPLPTYQRQYAGERYPRAELQPDLQSRNYRYQPRSDVARQHYQQQQVERRAPAPPQRAPQAAPQQGGPVPHDARNPNPPRSDAAPRHQQVPRAGQNPSQPGKGTPQERGRGKGKDEDRDKREG